MKERKNPESETLRCVCQDTQYTWDVECLQESEESITDSTLPQSTRSTENEEQSATEKPLNIHSRVTPKEHPGHSAAAQLIRTLCARQKKSMFYHSLNS